MIAQHVLVTILAVAAALVIIAPFLVDRR